MSDEESKGVAVASLFETEADASEDEAVSADEADDAEEGGGGIGVRDADDSEDGESSDEGPNPRKRRLRRAADVAIDEDELALLRENYRDGDVLGDDRSAKRARRGSADGEGGAVVAPSASTAAELAGALFTGGEGDDAADAPPVPATRVTRGPNFDNEMADFIIADEGDEEEDDELMDAAGGAMLNVESVEQRNTALSIFPGLDLYPQTHGDVGEGLTVDAWDEEGGEDGGAASAAAAGGSAARANGEMAGAMGFEPSQIRGSYLTEEDETIRATDMPERLLRFQAKVGEELKLPADGLMFEAEVDWIAMMLLTREALQLRPLLERFDMRSEAGRAARLDGVTAEVRAVLNALLRDHLEVPFIFAYKRDDVGDLLQQGHGWAVQRLHARFARLARLRASLLSDAGAALAQLAAAATGDTEIDDALLNTARDLRHELSNGAMPREATLRALQVQTELLCARIAACFGGESGGSGGAAKSKRGADKSTAWYAKMCRLGVTDLWRECGVLPDVAARNLVSNSSAVQVWSAVESMRRAMGGESAGEEQSPLEAARAVVERLDASGDDHPFSTPTDALQAFTLTAAIDLVGNERVMNWATRISFAQSATLAVKPTKKGREEIDRNHQYWGLHSLADVPANELFNDPIMWARVSEAAAYGFCTLALSIPGDAEDERTEKGKVRAEIVTALGGDGGGIEWEDVRRKIATTALAAMESKASRAMREKLNEHAREAIMNEACTALRRKLAQAPITLDDLDSGAMSLSHSLSNDQVRGPNEYTVDVIPPPQQLPTVAAHRVALAAYAEKLAREGTVYTDNGGFSGVRILATVVALAKPRRDDPAGYAVVVDGDGELLDYAPLPRITVKKESEDEVLIVNALAKLVKAHSPHLCVVGLGGGGGWRAHSASQLWRHVHAAAEREFHEQRQAYVVDGVPPPHRAAALTSFPFSLPPRSFFSFAATKTGSSTTRTTSTTTSPCRRESPPPSTRASCGERMMSRGSSPSRRTATRRSRRTLWQCACARRSPAASRSRSSRSRRCATTGMRRRSCRWSSTLSNRSFRRVCSSSASLKRWST